LCYPEGVLEDAIIQVGQSCVLVNFVVIETRGDESANHIGPTILMNHEGHHLCKARQDCFHHQGQKREVLIQEPHVALSCTTLGTIQTERVSVHQEEEEQ
jgi:hypothetical protein